MDITASLSNSLSHSLLAGIPTIALAEEGGQLEVDDLDLCDDYDGCWNDGGFCARSWCSGHWRTEREYQLQVECAESNPVFDDFHGMKQRRASWHAVERLHAILARRRRTTRPDFDFSPDFSRASLQEPIGTRNDVWREGVEKGALTTYNRRRCRCDYCMQLATLAQERRAFKWAVRRAEQGRDWEGGKPTTNKKLQWVDYDWDVEYGDAGENWDGAESVFEPGRVPPMEVNLLELVRTRGPQSRRAVQARRLLCSGIANQAGTKGSLSTPELPESNPPIESTSPTSSQGPLAYDPDWEIVSSCSEWDRCSVRSL